MGKRSLMKKTINDFIQSKMNLNQRKLTSESGFSLVELMVVVAIIGILAAIAVPQFQKFTFKARLTEAKAGLSSLFTTEKAFFGEWSQYDTRFEVIGYAPEGNYSFNIGFSALVPSSNWTAAGNADPAGPHSDVNSYCTTFLTRCKNMASSTALVDFTPPNNFTNTAGCTISNATTPPTFKACASANGTLHPDGVPVNLVINHAKDLRSSVP